MTAASPPADAHAGFRHEALLYAGADDFLAATVHFVLDGIARDEPILAALSLEKIAALKDALGNDGDRVMFADMAELGRNPARIIPAWRRFLRDGPDPGQSRRGIGEPIWAGRSDVELVEAQRHESLLNVAFDNTSDWWLLCPYDTTTLDSTVVDEARRSHPLLLEDGRHRSSPQARAHDMASAHLDDPLPDPSGGVTSIAFGPDDLRRVRHTAAATAAAFGVTGARAFELMVAVSEIATNSIRHGGGHGDLRMWADGRHVVCEVADSGALTNPLAGREDPDPDDVGRRGLWLANQLCDLVQIRVFPTGTVVRLHIATEIAM
ncbi:MAG TPA: sensor histidine kinase [Nocardioidaceae bacterium]|nr:sensor histidine kinase [Nocardioidaceae bacterium]